MYEPMKIHVGFSCTVLYCNLNHYYNFFYNKSKAILVLLKRNIAVRIIRDLNNSKSTDKTVNLHKIFITQHLHTNTMTASHVCQNSDTNFLNTTKN